MAAGETEGEMAAGGMAKYGGTCVVKARSDLVVSRMWIVAWAMSWKVPGQPPPVSPRRRYSRLHVIISLLVRLAQRAPMCFRS